MQEKKLQSIKDRLREYADCKFVARYAISEPEDYIAIYAIKDGQEILVAEGRDMPELMEQALVSLEELKKEEK